jgi:hypothetical protein
MKTIFEAIADAVWAALRADANLTAFMAARHGRWYDMALLKDTPLDVKPSDCPAVIFGPDRTPINQATNRAEDYEFQMALDLRTAEPSVWTAVNFFTLVWQVLAPHRDSVFGLGSLGLYDIAARNTIFRGIVESNRGIQWRVTSDIVFLIRRDARRQTLWAEAP